MSMLVPLKFKPVYRDYPWGGSELVRRYGRANAPECCAESWEIVARPEADSIVVEESPFAGRSLADLMQGFGQALGGTLCPTDRFPLLIKLIDANEKLSVQVHPDDCTAPRLCGEPKTEMWYILDAKPDSVLYAGLRVGTRREDFLRALESGSVPELLGALRSVPGQSLYVPGGTIHAIGEGNLLLEIQQNSDTTYRLYDWDRVGEDGQTRPLHLAQGLEAINWDASPVRLSEPSETGSTSQANRHWLIRQTPYFVLRKSVLLEKHEVRPDGSSFHVLFAVDNPVVLEWGDTSEKIELAPGDSCLVPASLPCYHLEPQSDLATTILTTSLS